MASEIRLLEQALELLRQHRAADDGDWWALRSPLRVCPLGAHVDHQHGQVTGLTLDAAVLLVFVPRDDARVRLWSLDFDGAVDFTLDAIPPAAPGDWGSYPRGCAWALRQQHGLRRGLDGVIVGSLPVGGLSSSAAVDVAYLLALQHVNQLELPLLDNIRLAQQVENDFIGLNNGILDQSIILGSRAGHLTCLDCRGPEFSYIPTPPDLAFDLVIAHSGVQQGLVGTGYNQRVAECLTAAAELSTAAGLGLEQPLLRDIPLAVFEAHGAALPEISRKRAAHFFGEQARVAEGMAAWQVGDLGRVGALMTASGRSSIDLYECGAPPLITLYELLANAPGIYGARFSGAGFRGACLALADPAAREGLCALLAEQYPARHPELADRYSLHFCHPGGPAELL